MSFWYLGFFPYKNINGSSNHVLTIHDDVSTYTEDFIANYFDNFNTDGNWRSGSSNTYGRDMYGRAYIVRSLKTLYHISTDLVRLRENFINGYSMEYIVYVL